MIRLLVTILFILTLRITAPPPRPTYFFLPVVVVQDNVPPIRGAQDETKTLYNLIPSDSFYHINIRWDQVEKDKGTYKWDSATDQAVQGAKDNGLKVIIGTRASPKWARKYPDKVCSQPKGGNYDEYAGFVYEIVKRYHPWGVEVWNEPDAKPDVVPDDLWHFGCFDSGKAYAEVTAYVYPFAKRADPGVKVIGGALAMADDKWLDQWLTAPYSAWHQDIISYHAYSYWKGNNEDIAKAHANKIRKYGDFELIVTETSLLDSTGKCSSEFEDAKAVHAQYVNKNIDNWKLYGAIWYTVGGNNWRCSDLTGQSFDEWFK